MNNYNTMVQVVKYIDQHIAEPITVTTLADISGYSYFHLCHSFQEFMGKPIASYLRLRKLEAAADMIVSGATSTKVAEVFGFETSAGFAKAFRKQFGMSPKEYKKHVNHYWSTVTPRIESKEGFRSDGILFPLSATPDLPIDIRLGGAYWKGLNFSIVPPEVYNSASIENHGDISAWTRLAADKDQYRFFFGRVVTSDGPVPEGLTSIEIPPTLYVVFDAAVQGNVWDLRWNVFTIWRGIFDYWLPSSDYEFDEGKTCLEFYRNEVAEIWIPIRHRQSEPGE